YDLTDTPNFDDDVTINGGSFSGQNSGSLSAGTNTLATDEAIAVGATHTYNLSFDVTINLSGDAEDTDGGDNEYVSCADGSSEVPSDPGFALNNFAEIDTDGDGDVDDRDQDCGDLPYLVLDKTFVEAITDEETGEVTVVYTVSVSNLGGSSTTYDLVDTPDFDNDVIILSGSYAGPFSGDLSTSGSTTLATGASIAAGQTDVYTLTFVVGISLIDGVGDEFYTECQLDEDGNLVPGTGLFNQAELNIDGDSDFELSDEDCGDLELPCELTIEIVDDPICDDNGTPTDPDDDFFYFSYVVTATNGSTGYITNFGEEFAYGVVNFDTLPVTFDPDPVDIVISVQDVNNPNCEAFTTVTPTGECSDDCAINASVTSSPICNDAGTGSDPSDDFITLGLTVEEVNDAGSGWTATLPSDGNVEVGSGSYGQEVTITIAQDQIPDNGFITILVTDNSFGGCITEVVVEVPDDFPCSDECLIEIELVDIACWDGGTPNDPSDDGFYAWVNVTGVNSIGWTAPDFGFPFFNAFGPAIFGPFPGVNSCEEITVLAFDAPSFCQASITVCGEGETCSDDCEVEASFGEPVCDNAGTPEDPTDDFFTIDITAFTVGQNNGDEWILFVDGEEFADDQPFNQTINYGPFPILGANGDTLSYNFRVRDESSLYCFVDSTIMAPAPCSDADPVCDLDIEVVDIECNPSDSDNGYFITINVTNQSQSGTYTVTGGGLTSPVSGTYGVDLALPELEDANGEVLTFTVVDDANPNSCAATFEVQEPAGCTECELMAEVFDPICDDNGTPLDGSDDTYTFDVIITGETGDFTAIFNSPDGTPDLSGPIGDTVTFGPFPANEDVNVTVFSDANDNCSVTIVVQGTGECTDCAIFTELINEFCDNGGTPDDPSDDTFGGSYVVTAVNASPAGFMYNDGQGNQGLGDYGDTIDFGPYPISGGDVDIIFMDLAFEGCDAMVTLEAPAENCGDCAIDIDVVDIGDCDQNGTPFDASDDVFTVTINVSGINTGSGWTSEFGGGNYNEDVTLEIPTGDGSDVVIL
ncbi:MAG: hypothetical protein AAFO91_01260, partial [Bacteroidota bacterium]